jgi:hypothetical protein
MKHLSIAFTQNKSDETESLKSKNRGNRVISKKKKKVHTYFVLNKCVLFKLGLTKIH